ncbi:MAG TPA: branched-chain amino acid ABC transporter permease [Spirochaetia bacterium]|nr:branched-chain amino acid ABC transporter permease [Spirochaetia bacterium]
MNLFWQEIINGLFVGAFYALVALGYSMVYGIIRLINFAHGDLYMVGSFVGFTTLSVLFGRGGNMVFGLALAFMLAIIVVGLLGTGVERIAYKPLRNAPILSLLISALGMSLILENGVLVIPGWGSQFLVYPFNLPSTGFTVFGVSVTYMQLLIFVSCLLLMGGLQMFVQRSILGKAMRAIALDKDAAQLMGININQMVSMTFLLGAALAGAAGVMAGLYYKEINFMMGFEMGLKAFTAAVIGGIGNIPGTVIGGFVLGVLEALGSGYLGSEWQNVFAFAILILLLVFKPTGILGEKIGGRM